MAASLISVARIIPQQPLSVCTGKLLIHIYN